VKTILIVGKDKDLTDFVSDHFKKNFEVKIFDNFDNLVKDLTKQESRILILVNPKVSISEMQSMLKAACLSSKYERIIILSSAFNDDEVDEVVYFRFEYVHFIDMDSDNSLEEIEKLISK